MRILKLRLSNLNSLSGAWEIDFTHPEYVNEGLFAITGATGAGKTTILDAICLALYGQTPRLGRITKSDNDIMSRQHGDCWAEVCFATEQGEYRAKWYQHRARRVPEGALQQAQHTLSEFESGTIIEESLSAVPARIETLSGLNFDRFMRSMMLAQGQFAAFLNAKESERSELLEQLTGTDIYAQISKRVFSRSKAEKDTLAGLQSRVGDINLLSEAECQQLNDEMNSKQDTVKQLVAEKQQKQALADWVAKLDKARQEARQLAAEQKDLAEALTQFADAHARLEQDKKVRPYASDLKQRDYFTHRRQRNEVREQELDERLNTIKPQLEQVKQQLDSTEDTLHKQQTAWQDIQHDLDQARQADVQIGLAERDHVAAEREAKRLESELRELKASQEKQQKQRDELEQEMKRVEEWLLTHSRHEQLATQLVLVEREQRVAGQLATKVAELSTQRDVLRTEYKTMSAMPVAEDQESALADKKHSLTKFQNKLTSAQRNLEQLRVQQHFESQRHLLKDGEACPLCGATDHPLIAHSAAKTSVEPEPNLQHAERDVARLTEALNQTRDELQNLKVSQAIGAADQQRKLEELKQKGEQCNQAMREAETEQHQILTNWTTQLETWELACVPDQKQPVQQHLQRIGDLIEQAAANYHKMQSQQQTLRQRLDQSAQSAKHVNDQADDLQARLDHYIEQEKSARHELERAREARQQYFSGRPVRDVEQQHQHAMDDAAKNLRQAQQDNQKLNEKRIELESEKRHLDEARTEIEAALQAITDRLQQAVVKLGFTDIEALAKALLDDNEQLALAKQAETLNVRVQKTDLAQQRNQQDIATASAEQPADPALNQQRLETLDHELNAIQREIGALSEQQRQDTQARERYQEVLKQVSAQQAVYDNWATLDGMIGSADGKKYRNFAQGLTFEIMIDYANDKLQKMSDRYLLVRDAQVPLALNVIDDYQGGEVRSTRNFSGGESFIVSLALALGLAQMASSRVRVDSLFLDEGFGTLDPDTLDVALDTLASLRQDGKMIGLISHVGALKERIATQLQVDAGAAGRSRLRGPGVRELKQN